MRLFHMVERSMSAAPYMMDNAIDIINKASPTVKMMVAAIVLFVNENVLE